MIQRDSSEFPRAAAPFVVAAALVGRPPLPPPLLHLLLLLFTEVYDPVYFEVFKG